MRTLCFVALIACNRPTEPPAVAIPAPSSPASVSPPEVQEPDASPAAVVMDASVSPPSSSPVVIRLERTPCLGTCPVYKLEVRADGSWLLGGWYPRKGCARGTLAGADLASLLSMARSTGYMSLKASYTLPVTDLPSVDTEVTLDGKTKAVHHYGNGRDPAEKSLAAFEQAIDQTVDTKMALAGPLGTCGPKGPYGLP